MGYAAAGVYVDHLHIRDLRCFGGVSLELVHPQVGERGLANVTLLVGDNGAGKTTVLRAIALGALNEVLPQGGYVPYSMVRRTPRGSLGNGGVEARLVVHQQDRKGELSASPTTHEITTSPYVERTGDAERVFSSPAPRGVARDVNRQLFRDESPGVLVLGYGATRRVDPASEYSPRQRRRQRLLRYERVSSLFEEQVALIPLAGWLPELQRTRPGLYHRVCELLDELIPDTRFTGELDGGEYLFERRGVKVGFAALSDGYRSYIGLLGDLFYHLCTGLRELDEPTLSRGIVLVDEIGLHLHPKWQRVVVPTLARVLPNLQFVLTSHSPIIAGTVYAENIRLLESGEDGLSHVVPFDEEIHGLNADQVLLTEAFGLSSSRAPDFVERYTQLRAGLEDPEDWKDALRLMRMYNRGSAGDEEPELSEPPEWVRKAARRLGEHAEDSEPAKKSSRRTTKKTAPKKKKP